MHGVVVAVGLRLDDVPHRVLLQLHLLLLRPHLVQLEVRVRVVLELVLRVIVRVVLLLPLPRSCVCVNELLISFVIIFFAFYNL